MIGFGCRPSKIAGPRSTSDVKVGGPVQNIGGPIKCIYPHNGHW